MTLSVMFCGVNNKRTVGGFYSRVVKTACALAGIPMQYTHVMLAVDTGESINVYELTMGGIYSCRLVEHEEVDTIEEIIEIPLDKNELSDLQYMSEVLKRVEVAELADIKGDWVDLIRVLFRRPMLNHNCVSFVRFLIGCDRDEDINTPDQLFKELQEWTGQTS